MKIRFSNTPHRHHEYCNHQFNIPWMYVSSSKILKTDLLIVPKIHREFYYCSRVGFRLPLSPQLVAGSKPQLGANYSWQRSNYSTKSALSFHDLCPKVKLCNVRAVYDSRYSTYIHYYYHASDIKADIISWHCSKLPTKSLCPITFHLIPELPLKS